MHGSIVDTNDQIHENARSGDSRAQFLLGGMYDSGIGLPKDSVEAGGTQKGSGRAHCLTGNLTRDVRCLS